MIYMPNLKSEKMGLILMIGWAVTFSSNVTEENEMLRQQNSICDWGFNETSFQGLSRKRSEGVYLREKQQQYEMVISKI
jgi:hypothetical protein